MVTESHGIILKYDICVYLNVFFPEGKERKIENQSYLASFRETQENHAFSKMT